MSGRLWCAAVAGVLARAAIAAEPEPDLAAAFGARPAVSQVSLSPDGRRIAFVSALPGQGGALFIVDAAEGAVPRRLAVATGAPERLAECRWATNARLVCTIYGQVATPDPLSPGGAWGRFFERLVAVPADGGHPVKQVTLGIGTVVDWLPEQDGAVIAQLYLRSGYGRISGELTRYDIETGKPHEVEQVSQTIESYMTDGIGHARIASDAVTPGMLTFRYRPPDGSVWRPFSTYRPDTGAGFEPVAIDPRTNLAWGFRKTDGRLAILTKTLDPAGTETEVYGRPDVDVDGVVRIGRRQRIIGVRYTTDALHFHYTDPELERVAAALAKALPATPIVRIVDASDDERRLLILAASDLDPGRYYLLDRDSRHLQRLMDVRPQLAGIPLAPMKPVSYKAADGTVIPAYLTLPPGRPQPGRAIVIPHGGPTARDEWGFDWLAQFFAAKGYAVLQPNFRGSSGYGDAFKADEGFREWRTAIGDIDDGARWLVAEGIASPRRLAIFGWSYGGYAALQAGATEPSLYKAIVAVAPVTEVGQLWGTNGMGNTAKEISKFRFYDAEAASPAANATRITAPVMLAHGTFDRNVGYDQSKRMAAHLAAAGRAPLFLTFAGLDHQLDDAAARSKLLAQSADFIQSAMER